MRKSLSAVLLAVGVTSLSALPTEEVQLVPSDDGTAGEAVAFDGKVAVIGARMDFVSGAGSKAGAAFIFEQSVYGDWSETAKLVASDAHAAYYFGTSVATDCETILIGSPGHDENGTESGMAYVFVKVGEAWIESAKLFPADGWTGDHVGESVALDGDTALIGATGADDNGDWSGAVHVFVRANGAWQEQTTLLASDGVPYDVFGWSVALDGDTAVIGAPTWYSTEPYAGKVYVFTRTGDTWTEQAVLMPSDGEAGDSFGCSVAVDDNTVVIGSVYDDDEWGSAYVFVQTDGVWTQQAKLQSDDLAVGDVAHFGDDVALDGDTAICGAYAEDIFGGGSGAAYTYIRTSGTWAAWSKLTPTGSTPQDYFGRSVALKRGRAVIGIPGRDSTGGAFVFRGFDPDLGDPDDDDCGDGDGGDDGGGDDGGPDVPAVNAFGLALLLVLVLGVSVLAMRRRATN